MQLDEFRSFGVFPVQNIQRLIHFQDFPNRAGSRQFGRVQIVPGKLAAVLNRRFSPCRINQDASHGFGGRRKETLTTFPQRRLLSLQDSQPCFVHQGRRLQCIAWFFAIHTSHGNPP